MGKALGEYLGRPVEFRNIAFDGLITALQTGGIDIIISSMTANEERRKSLDFYCAICDHGHLPAATEELAHHQGG